MIKKSNSRQSFVSIFFPVMRIKVVISDRYAVLRQAHFVPEHLTLKKMLTSTLFNIY